MLLHVYMVQRHKNYSSSSRTRRPSPARPHMLLRRAALRCTDAERCDADVLGGSAVTVVEVAHERAACSADDKLRLVLANSSMWMEKHCEGGVWARALCLQKWQKRQTQTTVTT